jgi:hypothetical protein
VRIFECQFGAHVVQTQEGQQFFRAVGNGLAGQQVHPSDEHQVLARRQIVEQSQIFRNDANLPLDLDRVRTVPRILV